MSNLRADGPLTGLLDVSRETKENRTIGVGEGADQGLVVLQGKGYDPLLINVRWNELNVAGGSQLV